MLTPMPADFWTQVVQAVATMIFQRETSRVVSISTAMQQHMPVTSYAHNAAKPWHGPATEETT